MKLGYGFLVLSYQVAMRLRFLSSLKRSPDKLTLARFVSIMRGRGATVPSVRDDGFDADFEKFLANEVCIVTSVGQGHLDPVRDHTQQGTETLNILGLSRHQRCFFLNLVHIQSL